MIMTRRRLIFSLMAAPQTCGHVSKGGKVCGEHLGVRMYHVFMCSIGGKRRRVHHNIVQVPNMWLRKAGAYCDVEQVVPELYLEGGDGDIAKARLDLIV